MTPLPTCTAGPRPSWHPQWKEEAGSLPEVRVVVEVAGRAPVGLMRTRIPSSSWARISRSQRKHYPRTTRRFGWLLLPFR